MMIKGTIMQKKIPALEANPTPIIVLMALLSTISIIALNVQPVTAQEIIEIRADGSISPSTAHISSVDNITYTFTADIDKSVFLERDNIVVDGAGHTLQDPRFGFVGIVLEKRTNITVRNTRMEGFLKGIYLWNCSGIQISGNNITENGIGIEFTFSYSSDSIISKNNIKNNERGILLHWTSHNKLFENNITANSLSGINIYAASYNSIYHNQFVDNGIQIVTEGSTNFWDDGYPSSGNYWSDYQGKDEYTGYIGGKHLGGDGIGDSAYIIDSANSDRFPLMNPGVPPVTQITLSGSALGNNGWFTDDIHGSGHDVYVELSTLYSVSISRIEYSFDNATWITYTSRFTITEEGETTVFYRSTYKNGSEEATKFRTIRIDATVPYGSVQINDNDTYTNSISAKLTLTAIDEVSGIAEMRFSNDNISWSSWQPYLPLKNSSLIAGDGNKTVYVHFKDNAGLISEPIFDTIILDTTPPLLNATSPSQNYVINSSKVTATWAGNDATSGIKQYEIRIDDSHWVNTGTNTTHTFESIADGNHTIEIKVSDNAGNLKQETVGFSVSTSHPSSSFLLEAAIITIGIVAAVGTVVYIFIRRKRTGTAKPH